MKKKKEFPTAEDILGFLREEDHPVSRRDIAKRFGVKGDDRRQLRQLISQLRKKGQIIGHSRNSLEVAPDIKAGELPEIIDVEVVGFTEDDDPFCRPVDDRLVGFFPLILMEAKANVIVGDIATVRLSEVSAGEFMAHVVEKPKAEKPSDNPPVMGIYRAGERRVLPLSKDLSGADFILETPPKGLKDGAVILIRPGTYKRGITPVTYLETIGDSPFGHESAIAIRNHGIPHVFSDEVLAEVEGLTAFREKDVGAREDLRQLPIVTIDGADAKDFDDAVWAEPWTEKPGGYHIIVAIADVAHYIAEGGVLDKEARKRGNSTYFPDMVVPMLPERLSNDLCSLRPKEDRPVTGVHMWIDRQGNLVKHAFFRGVIHSAARLTYEQVQAVLDKDKTDVPAKIISETIQPLYEAYKLLLKAREHRGALDFDIPESVMIFDDKGHVTGVDRRSRLDSHRLIEEMMVLANVAAASALQTKSAPCLYRVHPSPGVEKIENLKLALKEFGIDIKLSVDIQAKQIQGVAERIKDHEQAQALNMMILRSQEQARYDPENIGHFGLNLQRYAHFTSPIRRYSDLVVHRSLIKTLNLDGCGGLKKESRLDSLAEHLGLTERRSQLAEWEAKDRIITRLYHDFIGQKFEAGVVSVQRYGAYVAIDGGIAEGLLPCRLMVDDHYIHNPKTQTLTGKRNKKVIKLGTPLEVILAEADPVTGRLTFSMGDLQRQRSERRRTDKTKWNPKKHRGPRKK